MHIQTTTVNETKVKLLITADSAELKPIKEKVLKHIGGQHLKVAGFREGKAPLHLVEKNTDPDRLQSEFLEEAISRLYVRAAEKEQLKPVGQPQIQLKKFVPFDQLEFEAEVEIIGAIKLANYKAIKKTKPAVNVTAKEVNDVIKSLQRRLAERKEVSRAAKDGDEVILDFKGVDDKGKAVNDAEGKDYPLPLGSSTFIPGFEPNIVGLKPGEDKTFIVRFPKDYSVSALQGKDVTFSVRINKVHELVEPPADDAFAAQAGPFKTLSELKADIKKQLTAERQQEVDRAFENELLKEIAAKSQVAVPELLIDEQVENAEREERQNLAYRGQTWQEHLDGEGVTEAEHRTRQRPTAEESVKVGLLLGEIAEKENIQVTSEELEMRLQLLKGQYTDPAMLAELDKPEARRDIANRVITEKTIAKLAEYAIK